MTRRAVQLGFAAVYPLFARAGPAEGVVFVGAGRLGFLDGTVYTPVPRRNSSRSPVPSSEGAFGHIDSIGSTGAAAVTIRSADR